MAGANNAQMKAAGWRAADITKQRAEHGKLSHDVMVKAGHAPKKGTDPGGRRAARTDVATRGAMSLAASMMASRKASAAAKATSPAVARMRAAKANLPQLRALRDERRQRMTGIRQRVEFNRETKRLQASITPEMREAVRKAENGYGPRQARDSARRLTKAAVAEIRAARRYQTMAKTTAASGKDAALRLADDYNRKTRQMTDLGRAALVEQAAVRDAPRIAADRQAVKERVAAAMDFRKAAAKERRHATMVERALALEDLAGEKFRFNRTRLKKEVGFSPSWLKS